VAFSVDLAPVAVPLDDTHRLEETSPIEQPFYRVSCISNQKIEELIELPKNHPHVLDVLGQLEVAAWMAHNDRRWEDLRLVLAQQYLLLYGVPLPDGAEAANYLFKAAATHDEAEKLGDNLAAGNVVEEHEQVEIKIKALWDDVTNLLSAHWGRILRFLYPEEDIDSKAQHLGNLDATRWLQHHARDYNKLKETMTEMFEILLPRSTNASTANELICMGLQAHDAAETCEVIVQCMRDMGREVLTTEVLTQIHTELFLAHSGEAKKAAALGQKLLEELSVDPKHLNIDIKEILSRSEELWETAIEYVRQHFAILLEPSQEG
jgi:hypothetical protein